MAEWLSPEESYTALWTQVKPASNQPDAKDDGAQGTEITPTVDLLLQRPFKFQIF